MKELREILDRVDRIAPNERAILASVVDVKGSGYRLAGARMLIDESGSAIGSVSGGCLETDVLERAKNVLTNRRPTIVVYDSTKDDNSVFGLQMGCRGVVRILLEPANDRELFYFIRATFELRKTSAVATVISEESLGQRIYYRDGVQSAMGFSGAINEIIPRLSRDIGNAISQRRSRSSVYSAGSSELEVFIEVIEPPPSILIFGAGNDAIPVAIFAKQLGWNVTVVDRRPAYATAERFPEADRLMAARVDDLDEDLFFDVNSVAVLMTHHFESDRELLRRFADSPCRYIGILGPKQRTADLLRQLDDSGSKINGDLLNRVHAPVGLDIGASTPESIALSIVSEIQSALAGREGGSLKHRTKPIYDR